MKFPLLFLAIAATLAACGDAPEEQPFRLDAVAADNLVTQGMEKEILGDTVIVSLDSISLGPVISADGTKELVVDGTDLLVRPTGAADASSVLYDLSDAPDALALHAPSWSADGSEVMFRQIEVGSSDSAYTQTRVIIILGAGELE